MKLLITSGYNQSLHTIALLDQLTKAGVPVNQVIIVKAFAYRRIRAYYRQLDAKEFFKKAKDRILGNIIPVTESKETFFIREYLFEQAVSYQTVSGYCKANKIPFRFVNSLNTTESCSLAEGFDLAVYSGGGILKKQFLSRFKIGVLNCHAGRLPEIRGMNSAEWSVLLGIPQQNSVHFMVRKIDLGPILFRKEHDYRDCLAIDDLRGQAVVYAIEDLVTGVKQIASGNVETIMQNPEEGRQYYVLHPVLRSFVNAKLKLSCND